jgi:hypothetical protein
MVHRPNKPGKCTSDNQVDTLHVIVKCLQVLAGYKVSVEQFSVKTGKLHTTRGDQLLAPGKQGLWRGLGGSMLAGFRKRQCGYTWHESIPG